MDVEYKNWESGKGLEEVQAKIYTEVSGLPARAEDIGPRNDQRGSDMTKYALTKEGEPLAYITSWQSNSEPGSYGIGYPWSLPNCPKDVKIKMFKEQLNYLKSKKDLKRIRTAVVVASKTAKDQIRFFEENGFVEDESVVRFNKDFDVKSLSKITVNTKAATLKVRIATNDDVDILIDLVKSDKQLGNYFPTREAAKGYFEGRVLKDGHAVILFDKDIAVAASALLKMDPDNFIVRADSERIIPRFVAIRPSYRYAYDRLLAELAKEALVAKWQDVPLRVGLGFETEDYAISLLAESQPEMYVYEILMAYQDDKDK